MFFTLATVSAISIGDRLRQRYTKYDTLPITADQATSSGWRAVSSDCVPGLGVAFAATSGSNALRLYFSAGGQLSGLGAVVTGDAPGQLVQRKLWLQNEAGYYTTVGTRDPTNVCTQGTTYPEPLGDRLVINPGDADFSIPTTPDGFNSKYYAGSCFDTMGTHWYYDIASPGNITWVGGNLLPIVPMYYQGQINAIFFTVPNVQQGILSTNGWDPIPLPTFLMCKNFCASDCHFSDTQIFSTMHIYFRDQTAVTCPNTPGTSCFASGVGCCPGSS